MGEYQNTTYIKSSDPLRVLEVLENLFELEGMHRAELPTRRDRCDYEPMQYAPALENDLWGVAVFPGCELWTVIKTAPLELLSERAANSNHMRLSELCRELSTVGFQIHFYDGCSTLLCEVVESGAVYLSGLGDGNSEDETIWHGVNLPEEFFEAQFRALPYQHVAPDAYEISREFGGKNAKHCDNIISVESLIMHTPPAIEGCLIAYFQWNGPTRILVPAAGSWADWRELRNQ